MTDLYPIKDIKRAEYNPRVMPDSEMDALVKSLKTFGLVEPVVVNSNPEREGILIGGHQRTTAVERMIIQGNPPDGVVQDKVTQNWLIPAMRVNLDEEQERALNLALNKIHGSFDMARLVETIASIGNDSVLLPATGFSTAEIARILDGGVPKEETKGEEPECARCVEIRKQVEGHERKSGHTVLASLNPDV